MKSRHEKWLAIIGNINPTFSVTKPDVVHRGPRSSNHPGSLPSIRCSPPGVRSRIHSDDLILDPLSNFGLRSIFCIARQWRATNCVHLQNSAKFIKRHPKKSFKWHKNGYPLVNVYILPWKITMFNGKIHYKWQFSIAFCRFTRGYLVSEFGRNLSQNQGLGAVFRSRTQELQHLRKCDAGCYVAC